MIFSLMISSMLVGKCDSLPSQYDLEENLRAYYDELAGIETIHLQTSDSHAWMKWLPNVSVSSVLSYDKNNEQLTNTFRPSISYNLNSFYINIKERQKRQLADLQIKEKYKLELDQECKELGRMRRAYDRKVIELGELEILVEVDSLIFDIYEAKFARNEIEPLLYLSKKKSYLSQLFAVRRLEDDICELGILILSRAKW